jgi:hypothetical protein
MLYMYVLSKTYWKSGTFVLFLSMAEGVLPEVPGMPGLWGPTDVTSGQARLGSVTSMADEGYDP